MKIRKPHLGSNNGLSIIAAVTTLLLLLIMAMVAYSLISVRANISAAALNSERALYIAEAGLSVAKRTLFEDWSRLSTPAYFPVTSFAGGAFDADVAAGADPNKDAVVTVTGTYANSKRVIQAAISRYSSALESAIFTNGSCNLGGTVDIIGDIFYTGNYIEGGSVNVTGDISQTGQPMPGLDVASAIAQARANLSNGYSSRPDGNYFQGTFSPSPSSLNGVMFIDTYASGSPANVQISGNIDTTDENPALLIVMGDLRISGTVNFKGLIYTAGITEVDITLLGNMTVEGGIITSGDVTMRGNAQITYDPDMVITSMTQELLVGEDSPQEASWKEVSPP